MEILLDRENLMQSIETFLKKLDRYSFRKKPKVLLIAWDRFCEIKHTYGDKQQQELLRKLLEDVQNVKEELAEYIDTPNWDRPAFYYDDDDDDDEESSIPLRDIIISGLSPESEDASDGDCDLPLCDDSPKIHLTFSNPLFDIDDDFTSSDDESFSGEDILVDQIDNEVLESITSIPPGIESFDPESNLIESLLNQNTSIDSISKIDSLLDEFAGKLTLLKSIPPGIDEAKFDPEGDISLVERLLYDNSSPRPPEELDVENSIESFPPSHIPVEDNDSLMEDFDLFLASDGSIPPGIDCDYSDSEGDNFFRKIASR
ncbi:hypothetical protein Tco_0282026 [Tanacetum coccineum]